MLLIADIVIQPSSSNGSPENSAYKMSAKANSLVALYVHAWQLPQHDYRNDILLHWGKFEYMNFGSETFQVFYCLIIIFLEANIMLVIIDDIQVNYAVEIRDAIS